MDYRIVGYFENWAPYRQGRAKFVPAYVDASLLTHLNYAFGFFGVRRVERGWKPTGDFSLQPSEPIDETELFPAVRKLKAANAGLKTLLSLGGWSFNSPDKDTVGEVAYTLFSRMVNSPGGRKEFIASAIDYARRHGFDGIDLDWEYPGDVERGGSPGDFAGFESLLREFRATIDGQPALSGFLLTAATPADVPEGVKKNPSAPRDYFQWLAACSRHLHWLNVMAYDYNGEWSPRTAANAPLPDVESTVEDYLRAGIDKKKIVLGMPTYGRNFALKPPLPQRNPGPGQPHKGAGPAGWATGQKGYLAYYEVLGADPPYQMATDAASATPHGYRTVRVEGEEVGDWVSFEDPTSIRRKARVVAEKGLGGAMFWSLPEDDFANHFPLVRAAREVLKAGL